MIRTICDKGDTQRSNLNSNYLNVTLVVKYPNYFNICSYRVQSIYLLVLLLFNFGHIICGIAISSVQTLAILLRIKKGKTVLTSPPEKKFL